MTSIIGPASFKLFGIFPTVILSFIIPIIGIGLFSYIMARRIAPLVRANPDNRFDNIALRLKNLFIVWLGQIRQPRYMLAGVLHICIFFGFLVLSIRSSSLVIVGLADGFVLTGFGGTFGSIYNFF